MKNILFTSILVFCFTLVEAQNSESNQNSSESEVQVPQIFTKLKLLKTISVGDYKITFKSVESDGRCPEKVTCVWAGEAVVILEIESPDEITEKRFQIPAAGTSQSILKFENSVLVLKNIQPYPVSADEKIKDYYLLVDLLEKQSG
ncbi:hypothetical protein [Psychroflexus aestuariivivens]|uniref:hypothetical protein n=1 Tax=Psychroflexus aestuariivivens TaxID=1795040 RepID=UPI000FDCA6F9|nr:hypothetical protein [Psychroflexus aestuariivivens]